MCLTAFIGNLSTPYRCLQLISLNGQLLMEPKDRDFPDQIQQLQPLLEDPIQGNKKLTFNHLYDSFQGFNLIYSSCFVYSFSFIQFLYLVVLYSRECSPLMTLIHQTPTLENSFGNLYINNIFNEIQKFSKGTKFVAFPPDDAIELQNHLHDIFVNNVF